MGKIRVNTIGDESLEQKQKAKAEKRREAKDMVKGKAESVSSHPEPKRPTQGEGSSQEDSSHGAQNDKRKKMVKKSSGKAKIRSKRYTASIKLADKTKTYTLSDALDLLAQMERIAFDETVELHINTTEKINGNITLPHGTGKQTKIAILNPTVDATGAEKLLKDIEAGKIDFDILVATPDAMPKLAKVARVLGPKGLMPNPKNGTITPRPEEVAKKYAGGQVNFKTEVKANILHMSVGKISFGKEKLQANITTFFANLDHGKIKTVFIKTTMSPAVKLLLGK